MKGRFLGWMALTLVLVLAPTARADYQAGQRAWDADQTDEALAQWRSAADSGDRRAMLALGRLYVQGLGVLQDYVEAHKWLNLAASRGEAAALKERDALAEKMTPEERAEAQKLARAWRPGGGQAGVAAGVVRRDTEPATAPVSAWEGRPPPSAVREAQSLLGTLGYRAGPADGIWGRLTGEAYRAFLRDAGLPVASTLTQEALRAMQAIARLETGKADTTTVTDTMTPRIATPAPAPQATTAAMVPQITVPAPAPPASAIREAQALLAQLGYAPGPANGRWNESTARAYRAFVDDAGLPVTETLTREALQAMRATARRQSGGVSGSDTVVAGSAAPGALHRAAQAGDIVGLKAALAAGAAVDALDGRGRTALMHAVDKGYTLLVEPLLAAKAAVNLRAPDGATALFMAVAHGHTEIVAVLMRAGADVSIQGPKGKTTVDVARMQYGEPEAAREKGMDAAVLALLDGKTWAQVEEEVERAKRLAAKWPPGGKLRDCDVCPELVVIPAGQYRMGSPESEEGRYDSESPVHEVTIQEPFAVGIHEVTREEFGHFVNETGHSAGETCWTYEGEWKERSDRNWTKPGFRQGEREPVVCVNWKDAQAYVTWLSEKTGQGYRLLSESEWEYVARAGTRTPFHYGRTISTDQANYNGNYTYGSGREGEYREKTVPVGSYPTNEFGLHDVHGNVWEWVEDCGHDSYDGAPSDGSAWTSGGDCSTRVVRGGSWDFTRGTSAPPTAAGAPPRSGTARRVPSCPDAHPMNRHFLTSGVQGALAPWSIPLRESTMTGAFGCDW